MGTSSLPRRSVRTWEKLPAGSGGNSVIKSAAVNTAWPDRVTGSSNVATLAVRPYRWRTVPYQLVLSAFTTSALGPMDHCRRRAA
ncbi:hypothetical protein D3C87_998990 [compost metagenome]